MQRLTKIESDNRSIEVLMVGRHSKKCVVIFHEIWGMVPHIHSVCERFARLGFTAIAPNLFWRHKETLTPHNIQNAMEGVWDLALDERYDKKKVVSELKKKGLGEDVIHVAKLLYDNKFRNEIVQDSVACIRYALSRHDKVSTVGFCFGGGISLAMPTLIDGLSSSISFYGQLQEPERIRDSTAPMLAIYASNDELINRQVPVFVSKALKFGKDLTIKIFPRTIHGFFNETNTKAYNSAAASQAWELTKWFLRRTTHGTPV